MKRKHITAFVLACLLLSSGCDSVWTDNQVPDAVKVKFVELYPTIKQVDWDQEAENLYEAEFKISGRERVALFQADGNLVSYTEEIEERYLPDPVLQTLQQQYGNYKVEEVHRIQQENRTSFRVELEDKTKDLQLHFSEAGDLLERSPEVKASDSKQQTASLLPVGAAATSARELGTAEARWELPATLQEVSGIAMLKDGLLACVQDEEGKIFLYNLDERQVVETIPFAGPGDYEGIAIAGNTAFILRSDGTLFELADFRNGKPKVVTHQSPFQASIDMEGLAYDQQNNRLLLASKGHDKKLGNKKGIYAFSLTDKKMQPTPIITISLSEVPESNTGKKKKSELDVLQPSSLELHPETGQLYLLDAANNRLYTLDEQGKIQQTLDLDKKQLPQAEGLTFGPDGALYISSEAGNKKGKGAILKFNSDSI
jgi:uncharacterized protein YjiK